MVFGQKRLKTSKTVFLFYFAPNYSENHSKHRFSACFTYKESFSKFQIFTKIQRGYSIVFGQKRLKTSKLFFSSTLLPTTLKTTPKIVSRLVLPIKKVLSKFQILTKIQRGSPWFLAKNGLKTSKLFFSSTLPQLLGKPLQTSFLGLFYL